MKTMRSFLRKLNGLFANTTPAKPPIRATHETEVSAEVFHNYSFVIGSLFTYYNEMSDEKKFRFVNRVHQFTSFQEISFYRDGAKRRRGNPCQRFSRAGHIWIK